MAANSTDKYVEKNELPNQVRNIKWTEGKAMLARVFLPYPSPEFVTVKSLHLNVCYPSDSLEVLFLLKKN
jgi:hypothetical protein